MIIHSFTKKNIGLFYLSPYVEYNANKDKTVFRNDLFNKITIAPPINGNSEIVMEQLRKGIEADQALLFIEQNFKGNDPQMILDGLLQNGVIE